MALVQTLLNRMQTLPGRSHSLHGGDAGSMQGDDPGGAGVDTESLSIFGTIWTREKNSAGSTHSFTTHSLGPSQTEGAEIVHKELGVVGGCQGLKLTIYPKVENSF